MVSWRTYGGARAPVDRTGAESTPAEPSKVERTERQGGLPAGVGGMQDEGRTLASGEGGSATSAGLETAVEVAAIVGATASCEHSDYVRTARQKTSA